MHIATCTSVPCDKTWIGAISKFRIVKVWKASGLVKGINLRDNSSNGHNYTNYRFISNSTSGCEPAKGYNRARFNVSYNCTRNRSCLCNDKELGHVNDASKQARLRVCQLNSWGRLLSQGFKFRSGRRRQEMYIPLRLVSILALGLQSILERCRQMG